MGSRKGGTKDCNEGQKKRERKNKKKGKRTKKKKDGERKKRLGKNKPKEEIRVENKGKEKRESLVGPGLHDVGGSDDARGDGAGDHSAEEHRGHRVHSCLLVREGCFYIGIEGEEDDGVGHVPR